MVSPLGTVRKYCIGNYLKICARLHNFIAQGHYLLVHLQTPLASFERSRSLRIGLKVKSDLQALHIE